jgi:hypothetical protein
MNELLVSVFLLTLTVCLAIIIALGARALSAMRKTAELRREIREDEQVGEIFRMLGEGRTIFGHKNGSQQTQILCRRIGEPRIYICRNGLTFFKVELADERKTIREFLRSCDWWEEST